ncbi:type II CAAX prenyl endopeptidase Rce1 family protein [Pedobacter xixiisoli]|uniref:CAAX protease self-immunity n=1 Tax=Pedobacter xixiisoli TaxID=1476464 RepID=A0A286AD40_9SPHI|nr:CPBP family glutamic-type intramembrane protease [Pedobacter xixiisoli]SOD19821.1 CAAX protease self-immunity [Pedobacter xixiisoli]
MKKSLLLFYQFLKKPSFLKKKDKEVLVKDFAALFLLDLFFSVLIVGLFYILLHFKIIREHESADLLKEYGILGTLIIACFFAPILEEIFFRWHLRDLHGSIYFTFLSVSGLIVSQINGSLLQFSIVLAALISAAFTISFLKKKGKFYSVRIWRKSYPFLFYYTAIIFGLIHLSNFKDLTITDPTFLIYIASQTFGGLSLGYIRIKHGLVYSILFHACFNLAAVSLSILFP